MNIPKCWVCSGPILNSSCLHCGRSPEPERISMAEALLGNSVPEAEPHSGPRERVPLSVSMERARLWSKGLEAP